MLTTFEIYRRAEKCFEKCLPPEWIPTKPRDDIGVDYWVQITRRGSPTPLSFFVQVKGTTNIKETGSSLVYSLSTKKLKQYMKTPLPVLFVLCDIREEEDADIAYFCWVREAIRDEVLAGRVNEASWASQETVSLAIPIKQRLSLDIFLEEIQPVIDTFAIRHVQQENEHLAVVDKSKKAITSLLSSGRLKEFGLNTEDPKTVTALEFMSEGGRLQDQARHMEAIYYFKAAEKLLPHDETFLAESFSWEALGNLQEAVSACERGLVHHPGHPYLLSQLGVYYFRSGQIHEAFDLHVRAAHAKPEDGGLWANAGATAELIASTLHGEDAQAALEASARFFEKAHHCNPQSDFILNDFGLVCSRLYRFPKAVALFEKAIAINPKNITARRRLARAYLSLKQYDEAHAQVLTIYAMGARDKETENMEALIEDNRAGPRKDSYAQMMNSMRRFEFGATKKGPKRKKKRRR
ncbi:MAG: DUF4365 domain-containing protein [Desulfomonilia bacterium]